MECVFCKIVSKQIPANIIFENENVLAFYDLQPQAPVHFLVITKKHVANLASLDDSDFELIKEIFKAISEIAKDLKLGENFRVVNNCGALAGQSVNHVHFHVLSGRSFSWPPG